jgi:asparagine synthase (glutamine-hydrolysing)
MNGFCGSLTRGGTLEVVAGDGVSAFEEHLGCRVLVWGYIADRTALSRRLQLHPSRRLSDGELLAHAFRMWGRDLQAHVCGEYAAVICDLRAKTGLLTHDALGLAPLFYARRSDSVAFATHLVDLIDAATSETLDDEYLADFLTFGVITSARTPYRSIRRLVPGQSLWWSDGQLREVQTWDLADVAPVWCRDDGEYEEQFRALLDAGVRAALDTVDSTWISLSGGLDSSSVACVAAQLGARDLAAYSVVCPAWPEADEQRWMQAVVDRCGLRWHKVDVATILPFSRLPDEFYGEPTQAVIDEEELRVRNELVGSHGAAVMLTGHGGDTVLCASPGSIPTHLADPLFDGHPIDAVRAVMSWKNGSPERRSCSYWMLRALVEPTIDHLRARPFRRTEQQLLLPAWVKSDYASEMHLERRARHRLALPCRQPGRQALWDGLWFCGLATANVPQRRMTFESRNPLMYRPLVEFMCGVPWEQKLRPRCDRYLQRRALKGVLPELIRRRASKASGTAALVEGLRRSSDWLAYLCDSPMMAERGIVDADQWRHAVRQASVGQTHGDKFFLAGVAVETWLKQLSGYRARKLTCPALAVS